MKLSILTWWFSRDLHSDCNMFFPGSSYQKKKYYMHVALSLYTELGLISIASFLQNQ